jgi:hypothetical integral membrane protein (TIGR02206 family)
MFSIEHFIWLGIASAVIVFMLLLNKRKRLSLDTNLTVMTVVSILSEAVKIANNMEISEEFGGSYLTVESLPFHLCSIQLFFILYLKFFCKKDETRKKLMGFMFPIMLLGGVLAMLIPTCGTEFTDVQVYQYFGFHMFIVFFALYMLLFGLIQIDFKTIRRNYIYLFILMVIVFWLDCVLQYGGANFMYLARPPMEGLPVLNLDHGWHVYFMHLMCMGVICLFLVQAPFAFASRLKDKNMSSPKDTFTDITQ